MSIGREWETCGENALQRSSGYRWLGEYRCKGPFTPNVSVNAATTLKILKSMETLENERHSRVDANAWCKRALRDANTNGFDFFYLQDVDRLERLGAYSTFVRRSGNRPH